MDWVTVSQQHSVDVPDYIGALRVVLSADGGGRLEHGKPVVTVETGCGLQVRGSFDSSLRVKAHRGRVVVSGNPSRWGRADNLFGLGLDDCMLVINEVLAGLGLPAFTVGEPERGEASVGAIALAGGGEVKGRWTGAAFSRIDVCENVEAGSDVAARAVIRAYQSRAAAHLKRAVYGEETALFHNTRRSVKAYRKGPDMVLHCPGSDWADWALERGVVRHEVALKARWLSDTGLRYWGNLDMAVLEGVFRREVAVLGVAESLLDPVAIAAVERPNRLVYAAWLEGRDVRALVSRATYYRQRSALLRQAGIDIGDVRQVGEVVPFVRAVELRPCVAPAGYWRAAA